VKKKKEDWGKTGVAEGSWEKERKNHRMEKKTKNPNRLLGREERESERT